MSQLQAKLDAATSADSATFEFKAAKYNLSSVDAEGSHGIHNTKLVKKLLEDAIANFNPTGVEVENGLPTDFSLSQNYPNPFNPTTTISYSLKDESEVRIKIYAITGELIKTIIEGNKSKGYNETQIDLSNMASGIYLYRLEVTGKGKIPVFNDLKKMVLVK